MKEEVVEMRAFAQEAREERVRGVVSEGEKEGVGKGERVELERRREEREREEGKEEVEVREVELKGERVELERERVELERERVELERERERRYARHAGDFSNRVRR